MSRIVGFIIFMSIFVSIVVGMHLAVLFRFSSLTTFKVTPLMIVVVTLLSSTFPIASFLERSSPTLVTKFFYIVSAVWIGIVFIFSVFSLLQFLLSFMVTLPGSVWAGAIIGISLLVCLGALILGSGLTTKEIAVEMTGLDTDVTIVQLTDLHIGTLRSSQFLQRIVERTNSLSPDIVVITGDLFDSSRKLTKEDVKPLEDLNTEAYMITGNHEQYDGLDYVTEIMSTTPVRLLRNEVVETHGIQLIGIDHPANESRNNSVIAAMKLDRNKPSVLLYHQPSGLQEASAAGVDLQLSGHTHNGQIIPFNLLAKLFYPYVKGLHDSDGMKLYVSPGTGTWGPPMRIGSRNEITVVRLVKT